MKRITSVLLIICIIISVLTLTACSCDHDWKMIENVSATCEDGGFVKYKCSKCDLERQETSTKLNHIWLLIENTATCTESGEEKYVCSRCNQDRTENVDALGHNYARDGICKKCSKFKYNITVSNNLPNTFYSMGSYSGTIYSTWKIEKIDFTIEEKYYTYSLCAKIYGEKTYDYNGAYGTSIVKINYMIKDSSGRIIVTDYAFITGLVVSQEFGIDGYCLETLLPTSDINEDETYRLEIFNDI